MTVLFEWLAVLLLILLPTLGIVAVIGCGMRRGWWPTLLWQLPYRPVLILAVLIGLLALSFLAAMEAFALGNAVLIGFVGDLILSPLIALPMTAFLAWARDDKRLREDAARIRNQRLEADGTKRRVSADRHWPEYILDVQRARLRARYQPPD